MTLSESDEDRTFGVADTEPVEEDPALFVGAEVVPGEGNEVALQQLPYGEHVARPPRPDQPLLTQAATLQPLPARDHRSQEEVAEFGRGRDHPGDVLRRECEQRFGSAAKPAASVGSPVNMEISAAKVPGRHWVK